MSGSQSSSKDKGDVSLNGLDFSLSVTDSREKYAVDQFSGVRIFLVK